MGKTTSKKAVSCASMQGCKSQARNMLNSRSDMKDIRLIDVILGIKITRMSNDLILNQSHYVDKILEKFNKDDSGIARTPLNNSLHLFKNRRKGISQ